MLCAVPYAYCTLLFAVFAVGLRIATDWSGIRPSAQRQHIYTGIYNYAQLNCTTHAASSPSSRTVLVAPVGSLAGEVVLILSQSRKFLTILSVCSHNQTL
jgi:hypothetical protein